MNSDFKYIITFIYRPEKSPFKIVVESKEGIASALQTASVLEKYFKILSLEMNRAASESPVVRVTYFAEALSNDLDITKTTNDILSSLPGISCELIPGHGELLLDGRFPILLSSGAQGMIIPSKAFQAMVDIVRGTYGSGGEAIVYRTGFESGMQMAKTASKVLGRGNFNICYLMNEYAVLGHGRPEIVSHNEESGAMVVRLWGNVECMDHKSITPFSQFTRGHLCGFLSTLMERDFTCEEIKCIATGAEYCQFKLVPISSKISA